MQIDFGDTGVRLHYSLATLGIRYISPVYVLQELSTNAASLMQRRLTRVLKNLRPLDYPQNKL
jgi:hypothetical protein